MKEETKAVLDKLKAKADELKTILTELYRASDYWSEYDVPVGMVDRMHEVLLKVEAAGL
jgi:hypothetical protein